VSEAFIVKGGEIGLVEEPQQRDRASHGCLMIPDPWIFNQHVDDDRTGIFGGGDR
jgi:hypothetical protein